MTSSLITRTLLSGGYGQKQPALSHNPCRFISSNSHLGLKLHSPPSITILKKKKKKNLRTTHIAIRPVLAAQSNFFKVVQRVLKVGKDGVEAGTNLVPNSVPRPIARISVAVVAGTLALFVFKSILSTAFFTLAMMGLIYFTYIALNKDEGGGGPKGGGKRPQSTDDALDEAKRIMDKYK
ncbi:uncharacterized protein LOC124914464 [Impatiens glandulifera]|uniref:uncharacterized protein LOC124914464 n=1 Tax=Impatiens glandulifera TaxID=253017 RepID=UPI001FB11ABC|nr:uncharacterized protein LOC124914464 [Impatiens glandulifera]